MDGCCVRLLQGKKEKKTVYSTKPSEVAKKWESNGAKRIHIVDLDGAFEGQPRNLNAIEAIRKDVNIPLELGGGLRDFDSVEKIFELGINYAIVGTAAISDDIFLDRLVKCYGEKIIVGIDAREGKVAVEGWMKQGDIDAIELAKKVFSFGVQTIIFTDIKRDGMLKGPNISSLSKLSKTVADVRIIASGGISSLEDLRTIKNLKSPNIIGAIIGKALYEGLTNLKDAIEQIEEK